MEAKLHIHDVKEITVKTEHYPNANGGAGPFWTVLLSANGIEVVMFVKEEPTILLDFIQKNQGILYSSKPSDVVTAVL